MVKAPDFGDRVDTWRIVVLQSNDTRFPPIKDLKKEGIYPGSIILFKDEYDDQGKKTGMKYHNLGDDPVVYPVNFWRTRSAMPLGQYDPNNPSKPVCKSFSWYQADAVYKDRVIAGSGVIAGVCCTVDAETGREKDLCPLAQFSKKVDANGNPVLKADGKQAWNPPQCKKTFQLAVVVSIDDGKGGKVPVLAEIYFKGTAEREGQAVIAELIANEDQNIPIYCNPITLTAVTAGAGFGLSAKIGETRIYEDDSPAMFEHFASEYGKLIEGRLAASMRKPEDQDDHTPAPTGTVVDVPKPPKTPLI
jgi:hypothetical protein